MESVTLIGKAIRYAEDLYRLRDIPVYKKWGKAARKTFSSLIYPSLSGRWKWRKWANKLILEET